LLLDHLLRRRSIRAWAPPLLVMSLASALVATMLIRNNATLRRLGWEEPLLDSVRSSETSRWIVVLLTSLVVSCLVAVSCVYWKPQTFTARALGLTLIGVALLGSCQAAFWPERSDVAAGYFVHPPRLAIYAPILCAALTLLVSQSLSRWRPDA
jgi:hypothetical protein